ncbi:MAG: aminopeptidase N [Pseudomonadota bacterium]
MRDATPQTIYLKDYTPFGYLIDSVSLNFHLAPAATRVTSRIAFRPNPKATAKRFFLHGEELSLLRAKVDGRDVSPTLVEGGLELDVPAAPFTWEAEVEISPQTNTALEGLYMSNGMYCTQCEAEGFRKITYYPDRPDVMAVFDVRIEGNMPVLLSNGNLRERGEGFASWHDPWPKPAYLFALVAGDLVNHPGAFTTRSGKRVELNIWVRPGPDETKCAFGMDALRRSMAWDERVYGREYDLDIFNIVAVDDFNMGAMENKGLNIFNSSTVLCSPETSTDTNFERIEAVIAHEYFHNWTGNRITCRDWFQLCLKEGLTVFRDQQFTADERSAAVARIRNVIALRGRQFREDSGPLAHPPRPDSFVEINNFYTATVYEKGAEVIRMLRALVGEEGYARALTVYFDRHDGQACTIEDWLRAFEEATGRDLSRFKRWYTDAGTPRLKVGETWREGIYTLTFTQQTPPTPGQDDKPPRAIPIAVGLLTADGEEAVPTTVLEMTEKTQSFTFSGLKDKPVPSILRGFSAPVILQRDTDTETCAFLFAHDTDPFNKWEAGRQLAKEALTALITEGAPAPEDYIGALSRTIRDSGLDPAFRALTLALPGQDDMAQTLFEAGITPDPLAIWQATETLKRNIAQHMSDIWPRIFADMAVKGPYSPDAVSAGKRSLTLAALDYLSRIDGGARAASLFATADNMTLQLGALSVLTSIDKGADQLAAFRDQWRTDRLVIDKWFSLQASLTPPQKAAGVARALTEHPDFELTNPNRFRSVIGALAMNPAGFHDPSGASYDLVADWLIKLDPLNPQTTARMTTVFETWHRYDADRRKLMTNALERIKSVPGLSRATTEMVTRLLNRA